MLKALFLMLAAAAPSALIANTIQIVPAYTGSPDDLVVVRTWSNGCPVDARASLAVHNYRDGVLSFSLPGEPPGTVCRALARPLELAYTLRELGMSDFPETLTVRYTPNALQGAFSRQIAPTAPRLAAGWWKTGQGTLNWHQSREQLGVLITGQADNGSATWRVGGGDARSRGAFDLYQVSQGTSLRNQFVGPSAVAVDGNFEYAIEGPALVWVRFAGTDIWSPSRPYYFGEELNNDATYFSQYNGVSLEGSWRNPASDAKVEIEAMPAAPEEPLRTYSVTIGGARGFMRCDSDSCTFDSYLPAPFDGADVPTANISAERVLQLKKTGWETLLLRNN